MSASVFLWGVAGLGVDVAAESDAAFQACLQAQTKQWIDARVELVLNEDPAAGDIDDAAVAGWTLQALKTCAAKAGGGDPASEQLFVRYMARWREHIDAAAAEIRRRLRPD